MNDKTDPNAMNPALARQFIEGTLKRIQQKQPDFYPYVLREIQAQEPGFQLSGLFDSLADIGTSLSSAIGNAATAYGGVLVNRENAKTAAMVAQDQAKAQISVMNSQLQAQQQATNNAYAQQQLALQQQQLFKAGTAFSFSDVSPMVWIIGGVAVLGMVLMATRHPA